MKRRSNALATNFLIVAFTIGVVACGGGGAASGPSEPAVSRIDLTPATLYFVSGETQQMVAALYGTTGTLVSGPSATWQVDDNTVATISSSGLLRALAPGQVTVSVTAGGITASALAVVTLGGDYILRTANGIPVPWVVSQPFRCNPADQSTPGQLYVYSGDLLFRFSDQPNRDLDTQLSINGICGPTSYITGEGFATYAVKGGIITFTPSPGFLFKQARISNDTITIRWIGPLTDTLEFVYTKS